MMLVCSSAGGLCFTEGNSRCRVLKGLLQTFMLCFLRVLDKGSVIPVFGYPFEERATLTSVNLPTTDDSKSKELKHVSVALASEWIPENSYFKSNQNPN